MLVVMRCVRLCMLEACGGWDQFRGFEISVVAAFSLQPATDDTNED